MKSTHLLTIKTALSIVLFFIILQSCNSGNHNKETKSEDSGPDFAYTENNTSLSDLDFTIKDIETNYSGFRFKVTDENRPEYDSMIKRVRKKVVRGRIDEFEAVAMYLGYFQDHHLHTCYNGENDNHRKYLKNYIDYGKSMTYAPDTLAVMVTENTFLIRYPSCQADVVPSEWVSGSLDRYFESGCENLILDIRGNEGGNDSMYSPYLRVLYDHPGTTEGILFFDTEENRKIMESYRSSIYEDTPLVKENGPSNEYVSLFGETMEVGGYDDISSLPKKAALIIDNQVVSSGEQLILDVRACSDRCVVYGRDNSQGCIDFSNCRLVKLSGNTQYYQVPMTVSHRVLNGTGVDECGIAPDVRVNWEFPEELTDNIDSWSLKVAHELEK